MNDQDAGSFLAIELDEATGCPHDRDEITLAECAAEGCEGCKVWLLEQAMEWREDREEHK